MKKHPQRMVRIYPDGICSEKNINKNCWEEVKLFNCLK